jgi:diguanylate cyclase (GGDEF)-like protein/PAS domain S-box-containing protein
MSEEPVDPVIRARTVNTLRARPDALFIAMDWDGWCVPMPESVGLRAEQVIPIPSDPSTMVDLAVPMDGYDVIRTWHDVRRIGMGMTAVRPRSAPDRTLSLLMIDVRDEYGVLLGVLTTSDTEGPTGPSSTIPGVLAAPVRPRTAGIVKDRVAVISAVDERATRMLGWTPEQMIGVPSSSFVHPDDQDRALSSWMEMLYTQQNARIRLRHRCADGTYLWVEIENIYQHAENAADIVVASQVSDISDEMAAHEEIDRRERLFRRLAEAIPSGLLQLDADGVPVYANDRLGALLGVPGAVSLDEQLATMVPEDRAALVAALDATRSDGIDRDLEVEAVLFDTGERRRFTVSTVALTERDGTLVCFADITDSARMREELRVKATFDGLTGCHNRASVLAALEHAIATDDRPPAVIFVDLDRFKPVNDRLGHAAGDELLVHTARTLAGLVRHDDIVGRVGGDEFLVVCRRPGGVEEVLDVARRVRDALAREVTLSAGTVRIGGSIGVAQAWPGATGEAVVARADAAMYESKRHGDGSPVIYRSS